MDVSGLSDQELVDRYARATAADPTSPEFAIDEASALAHELEQRGFTESDGSWRHPEKGTLVNDP